MAITSGRRPWRRPEQALLRRGRQHGERRPSERIGVLPASCHIAESPIRPASGVLRAGERQPGGSAEAIRMRRSGPGTATVRLHRGPPAIAGHARQSRGARARRPRSGPRRDTAPRGQHHCLRNVRGGDRLDPEAGRADQAIAAEDCDFHHGPALPISTDKPRATQVRISQGIGRTLDQSWGRAPRRPANPSVEGRWRSRTVRDPAGEKAARPMSRGPRTGEHAPATGPSPRQVLARRRETGPSADGP